MGFDRGALGIFLHRVTATLLRGPQMVAFLPAITLFAFWVGGERALIVAALTVPAMMVAAGSVSVGEKPRMDSIDTLTGLEPTQHGVARVDEITKASGAGVLTAAAVAIAIDDIADLTKRFGQSGRDQILRAAADRLRAFSRNEDILTVTEEGRFALLLVSGHRRELEVLLQLSARIQSAFDDAFSIGAARVYVSVSVGFCQPSRCPGPGANDLLEAAEAALNEAMVTGTNVVRAYSKDMPNRRKFAGALIDELSDAMSSNAITPWFQPQVSADFGNVSGIEALARWNHPQRGLLLPGDFLPIVEEVGLSELLGEVILRRSLIALRNWDQAGVTVPSVSVNFSGDTLRNPKLVEKVQWELDRFDLTPDRLTIEVVETVLEKKCDDIVMRNLTELGRIGCSIDLDDFGTGNAGFASIQRFGINRIKIHRGFVSKVDLDRGQQNIVSGILTLAERLGVDTLAHGVETVGEHAQLSQLGCGHVQGTGICRPLPFDDVAQWLSRNQAKLAQGLPDVVSAKPGNGAGNAPPKGKTA